MSVLYGANDSGQWGPPLAELIPVAVLLPFHLVGKGDLTYTHHMGEISTPGTDLLGVLQLQVTWVRKVTDGSNLRDELLLEPNEPRHVSNAGTME